MNRHVAWLISGLLALGLLAYALWPGADAFPEPPPDQAGQMMEDAVPEPAEGDAEGEAE